MRNARAVALVINSPGGSPVQSHLIYRRIRELADEKKRPVIAFVEDVAASGGYMIACAADEIICDPFSIVGSIGVVGGSFGFAKLMDKLGVERRLYTSGEHKAMLDPFLPEKPEDVKRIKAIQKEIHERLHRPGQGTAGERDSRAPRRRCSPANSGPRRWRSSFGLADRIGDLRSTLRQRYGDKVRMPVITAERGLFGRWIPGLSSLQALTRRPGFADEVISALEARALWGRYGL